MGLSAICIHNLRKFSQLAIDLSGSVVIMGEDRAACRLIQLGIPTETEWAEGGTGSELREQMDAIERWYRNDWIALDNELRSP